MINVWGDSVVCAIVAHLSKKEIAEADERSRMKALENGHGGHKNEAMEMDHVKRSDNNINENKMETEDDAKF